MSTLIGPVAIEGGSDNAVSAALSLTSPANGFVLTIESTNDDPITGLDVTVATSLDGVNYGSAEVVADFPSGSAQATVNAPGATTAIVTVTNRDISPATVTVIAEEF